MTTSAPTPSDDLAGAAGRLGRRSVPWVNRSGPTSSYSLVGGVQPGQLGGQRVGLGGGHPLVEQVHGQVVEVRRDAGPDLPGRGDGAAGVARLASGSADGPTSACGQWPVSAK